MRSVGRSWLRPLLQPLWPTFREVVLLSFCINLLALAVPVFVMQVYDRVVFHAGLATLEGLVIGIVSVLAFDWVLRQSRARILQAVALRLDVTVGRSLFEKIMALPLALLETRPAAHWHALFRDVDIVRNTLSGTSALMVCDLPFAVLFLILTFVIAQPIAFVLVLFVPAFVIVAWRSGSAIIGSSRRERESGLGRDNMISEIIAGRTTVKALSLDRAIRPLWEERHAECIERAIVRGSAADGYTKPGHDPDHAEHGRDDRRRRDRHHPAADDHRRADRRQHAERTPSGRPEPARRQLAGLRRLLAIRRTAFRALRQ
jgi:ATP-binding cassette subfamily C protein LapB